MDEEFGKHVPTRSDRHKKQTKPTKEEVKQYKQDKREHQKKEKQKSKGFFIEREIPEVEDVDSIWDDDPVREPIKIHPLLSIILILMLAAFGAWGGHTFVSQNLPEQNNKAELPITSQEDKKEKKALDPINILIIGCDEREGEIQARSDVIIVATLRPEDKKVAMFSIPRDTYVPIKGHGQDKLNHAMAFGGVNLVKDTVERFLDMDIDYTVKINFDGFINVVDALGGVTVNVEQRMYKPLESIDLYPGEQTLMGKDALAFVRWRGDGTGDYGRIGRQQEFMNALVEKLKTMSLGQALDLVGAVMDSVSTDMSVKDMATYGYKFLGISSGDLQTYSFVGDPIMIDGVSYVKPNEKAIKRIVDYMQNGEPATEETTTPQE